MNREIKYLLTGLLLIVLVILLDVLGFDNFSFLLELTILPVFAILYFWKAKLKKVLFSLFIGLYAIGDVISLFDLDDSSNVLYYICNTFFITGYVFLLLEIVRGINFKSIFKNYKLEFLILILLFVYMIYVLINIVKPISFETDYMLSVQIFELLYNIIVILVLIASFLNYIQNTNNKHLILFIGSSALVFSELILIGYYYILDDIRLSYLSTTLYITGFLLILYQSQLIGNTAQRD